MEFVGHQIDFEGISMTDTKLDSIRNFPIPQLKKGLKSFIGLANYFRDHVRGHSDLAKPLQDILEGYSASERNHKIKWTPELVNSFETLKEAVSNCQKLYFIQTEEPSEVVLLTDASDYGIGAYLLQRILGVEYPIRFISKSLSKQQTRWSTPEKEMFAIWYALKKLDHLVRDIPLVIMTDHKNLVKDMTTCSPKVVRWQLDIQGYTHHREHIAGSVNVVADDFSRLCAIEDSQYLASLMQEESVEVYYSNHTFPEQLEEIKVLAALSKEVRKLTDDVYEKIRQVHNSVAGHHGVERTLNKLHQKNERWAYMREHIRFFIQNCPCCQKMSVLRVPIETLPFTTATYSPMTVISVDTIGPLPEDNRGNKFVLTIVDTFTRYVQLYAIVDVTAQVAIPPLLDHIGRFGCPTAIQSDNGSQFVNELVEELLRIVGTEHIRTLQYSKEENGIVERANKESLRHLRALVFSVGTHTDWSLRLGLVSRILNSTVHDSIGVNPSSLLFGNVINLDRGIFLPLESLDVAAKPLSRWSADMLSTQKRLLALASNRQRDIDNRHLSERASSEVTEFPVNSLVLVAYPDGPLGRRPPTKLHTNLRGPMRVISNIGAKYTLYDFVSDKEITVHLKALRKYHTTRQALSPQAVAMKDKGEFVVHSIVAHTGDEKRKSLLDFKVHWEGYSSTDDEWLPWRSLRNNPKLHEYLRSRNLGKLIPKEHRNNNLTIIDDI
jgi:transposase InsO family protein